MYVTDRWSISATIFQISPIFGLVASFDVPKGLVSKFCPLVSYELSWGPRPKWVYSIKLTSDILSVRHRDFGKMTFTIFVKKWSKIWMIHFRLRENTYTIIFFYFSKNPKKLKKLIFRYGFCIKMLSNNFFSQNWEKKF